MKLKKLNSFEIRVLLEEEDCDFCSDYEENTDEEEVDDIVHDAISHHMPSEEIAIFVNQEDISDEVFLEVSDATDNPVIAHESSSEQPTSSRQTKRKWRVKPEPSADTQFRPPPPAQQNEPTTPLEAFFLFFDDELLKRIHFETNLKSVQKGKPASITENELKVFIGINIIMGYNKLPTIRSYWSVDEDLNVPCISRAMARDRFQAILSNLHLNDNTKMNPNQRDKLFKVRPLLEHLNRAFFKNRNESEHLSIDESTIRFKGRSSLKQYNPMKPIKRGYKLWCLADDDGYIYHTDIYTGKSELENSDEDRKEFGLGGSVVLSLLKNVRGENHKVFMDNFFSSIPLMEELKNRGILACGTIRSNRKDFPQLKNDKVLKRGEFDYRSTPSGITVFKWKDSKAVNFISNFHGITTTTVQRKQKDGTKTTVSCPQVVKDYNAHMGGVDKHDMLRQLYGTDRKNVKWWHRIFFGLMDMTLVNSFVLFTSCNEENSMTLLDFYREVGCGLLTYSERSTSHGPGKRRRYNYPTPDSVRLGNTGIHWPEFTNSKNRCQVCSTNNITSRPLSKCSHCGVHLCCNAMKNCFVIYHKK